MTDEKNTSDDLVAEEDLIKDEAVADADNTETEEKKECNCVELENKYKRALADYQNLLRQTAKEKEEFVRYANENLLQEILPVYDNLKISLNHAGEDSMGGLIEGIKHVVRQFADTLKNIGVEEIKTIGEEFDHNTMEAIDKEKTDDEKKDNIVSKEMMPGYKLKDKIIRAAKVAVYEYKK